MLSTRQEAVICLAIFNKFAKQIIYNVCALGELRLSDYALELMEYEDWIDIIKEYAITTSCPIFIENLNRLGTPMLLETYLSDNDASLPDNYRAVLQSIVSAMNDLQEICTQFINESKGDYSDLADGLDNPDVADLLSRAVNAGFLTSKYQPKGDTDRPALKLIAFAVIDILHFAPRHSWALFERQWNLDESNRLAPLFISDRQFNINKQIVKLYPEADFNKLNTPKDVYFTNKYGLGRIKNMFVALKREGYIAKETTVEDFYSIFNVGKENMRKIISWQKEQWTLVYFANLAFSQSERELWLKVFSCFTINGYPLNRGSLKTCLVALKKKPNFNTLEPKLRKIASDYIYG